MIVDVNNWSGKITFFSVVWAIIVVFCGFGAIALVDSENILVNLSMFVAGCSFSVLTPLCRNRRCRAHDYTKEGVADDGTFYRCKCGDLYLLTHDERFLIVEEDGTKTPYRQRFSYQWWPAPELFSKWKATQAPPEK